MLITPLPQGFGAEVSEFDTRQGRDPAEIARLQEAFRNHHLLVFRSEGEIAPERQVEITGWFGPLICEGSEWTVLDNDEPSGSAILPFHSDITYLEHPLAGISLYPQALPDGPTSTTYVSNARGWEALPEALKQEVHDAKARHFLENSDMGYDWPPFEYWHPIRRVHEASGQPLLFVTEYHVSRIEGMDEERTSQILEQMFAALYAPERQYEHVWRPGDLVVWDNFAVQHARTKVALPSEGRRVMRRVQLGRKGFMEQLAALRPAGAAQSA